MKRIADLPPGRFRTRLDRLTPVARQNALEWLQRIHLPEADTESMEVDDDGGVYYVDNFTLESAPAESEPVVSEAAVPVNPLPASLVFHSRPGAPNLVYLDFTGEDVSGTAWNSSLGRTLIPAVAFSTDTDLSTFSTSEQQAIKRIWQRVAEDYAPFHVDVTTERPTSFGSRVAHALITRNTDANGDSNPSSSAGGVAYISVFAGGSYSQYRPVWIYGNNLSGSEANIAEAVSHEIGHNLGLSHDGKTDGVTYYNGHGSGDTSWGPIMGTGYGRNVSQWSKGEYYLANNTEDDLAVISGKLSYRSDDHGNSRDTATPLTMTADTNIVSTTPEADPGNSSPANKGVLERNTDVDVFSFLTGNGPISLTVNPWIMASGTRGGNLDVLLELYDETGGLVLTNNAANRTLASIQTTLPGGRYFLYVRNAGVGDPLSSAPSGYTSYASIGKYFISGYVTTLDAVGPPATEFSLTVTTNQPTWGNVNPTGGMFPPDSSVQITATPATYFRFANWSGSVTSTNNPLTVVLNTNVALQALFSELLTTNHPTPLWWLASYGYTKNLESAVEKLGNNGLPLWQSYIAGLNPNDAGSQLRLTIVPAADGNSVTLQWNAVTGRVYTVCSSTNLAGPFAAVPNAANLPATITGFTNGISSSPARLYYRLEVRKP